MTTEEGENAKVESAAMHVDSHVPRVRVGTRSYYSTHLLAAAQDAASAAEAKEKEMHSASEHRFSLGHRGPVLTSIILSAAFVEAAINEVLQDAADGHVTERVAEVRPDILRSWAALWEALARGRTGSALDLYQAALIAGGLEPFDKGTEPWQGTDLLRKLRNHLVHYKPETVFSDEPTRLVKSLRSRLAPNPLSKNVAEVDGWLSAQIARWAVESAVAFVEDFSRRASVRPNYQLTLDSLREHNA